MSIEVIADKCVGCGLCLKSCPFGAIELDEGVARIKDNCTLCGACKKICPAGIDHPAIILEYRKRQIENGTNQTFSARLESVLASCASAAMGNSTIWNLAVKCARPFVNSSAKDGYINDLPLGAKGWFACRDLKAMPDKAFHDIWKELENTGAGVTPKKEKP